MRKKMKKQLKLLKLNVASLTKLDSIKGGDENYEEKTKPRTRDGVAICQ
ncbi:hypothetical protein [Kordia sp.]